MCTNAKIAPIWQRRVVIAAAERIKGKRSRVGWGGEGWSVGVDLEVGRFFNPLYLNTYEQLGITS